MVILMMMMMMMMMIVFCFSRKIGVWLAYIDWKLLLEILKELHDKLLLLVIVRRENDHNEMELLWQSTSLRPPRNLLILKRKGYVIHKAGTTNFIIITSHGISSWWSRVMESEDIIPEYEVKSEANQTKELHPTITKNRAKKGEKRHKCGYCCSCFATSSECKVHERVHTKVKPYKCKYCDKFFTQSSSRNTHEQIHMGLRPHKCTYCEKHFDTSTHRKRHEQIHTGVKPYKCNYCDRYFNQMSHCKTHEQIHTKVKPYKCKYCDKCFHQLSNCKRHERVHMKAVFYRCKYCDECFSKSTTWKQHEEIHARESPIF